MLNPRPYLREVSLKRAQVQSYEHYPFSIAAVRKLQSLRFHPDVTFIVGENGCGKSTLLEAIATAWGFNPEGGTINFRFSSRASHSGLHEQLRLVRSTRRPKDGFFLRAESFFNVATDIERRDGEPSNAPPVINSYGGRSLHEQSHGESFLALLLHRFGGDGFYVLDEPEAALSPTRQPAVLRRIHQLVQQNSQFIIATHSPILMAYPAAKIFLLDETGFTEVGYQETEHYAVTKEFINDPCRMVREVLAED
ncbi:MAG: AAA family ATPase [Acidobacteriota bacterium]